jgi:hypothetical protein
VGQPTIPLEGRGGRSLSASLRLGMRKTVAGPGGVKSESASRPPSEFWCLNDKTIKELMTFAKCETRKMSYKLY